MPRSSKAVSRSDVCTSVREKADRYFAEQCQRLGPIDTTPETARSQAPRRSSRSRLDNDFRRLAKS